MKQFSIKKFFVKHTKIIMTLVSVGLMFVFALPTFQRQNKETRDKAAAGFLDGVKVTNDDIAFCRGELNLLREMHFLPRDGQTWIEGFAGEDSLAPLYWYLICNEASRYTRVAIGPDQAVGFAADNLGATDNDVRQLLFNRNINAITLARVVSKLQTVIRYQNFLLGMPEPVTGLELSADRQLKRAEVQYVPIDPIAGWDKLAASSVTADQIKAQFEAYKDVFPTPVPAAPDDPPVFLGLDVDEKGACALLGYPGAVEAAFHVHQDEIIPWDGSKLDFMTSQGGMGVIVLSGGGRVAGIPVFQGQDIHGRKPPALPAEINGHRYPFGYKFTDRVKVEYLKFNFAELRQRMEPTQTDVQTAFKVFQAKPYKFRPQAATAPATPTISVAPPTSEPASAPATAQSQPASRSAEDIQKDWDDPAVKKPFIDEQVDLRCAKLLKNMLDAARSRTEAPWKGDNAPARNAWLSYQKLAADLGKDAAYLGYQPEPGATGADFLGEQDLRLVPGLGQAIFTNAQGQIYDFPALATNIQEFVTPGIIKRLTESLKKEPAKNEPAKTEPTQEDIQKEIRKLPLGRLNIPMGQEAAEVMDKERNLYLFRTVDFQPAHAAANLDEKTVGTRTVGEDVLADCRKLAASQQRLKELQAALAGGDLKALAEKFQSKVRTPLQFNSDPSMAPTDVQYIRDFVKTTFTLPEPAEGKPPSVKVLENDERLMAYALKLERILPTSSLNFAYKRLALYNQPNEDVVKFYREYMKINNLAARLKFTSKLLTPKPTP